MGPSTKLPVTRRFGTFGPVITDLNAALRRYREERFTDQDVTRCTGFSVRAWRELIKLKAVRTEKIGRGPGRVRVCDATTLKRAAVISALNESGLSLALAGQITFFVPFHTLLYVVYDPITLLLQSGLPPHIERPLVTWFDPDKPAKAEPETDWIIEIFDGRFVGVRYDGTKDAVSIFGDLRQQGTRFVAWLPFSRRDQFAGGAIEQFAKQLRGEGLISFVAGYEDPSRWPTKTVKELSRFGYRFENHEGNADPLCVSAEETVRGAIFKSSINVSLAVRKALRRCLGMDPAAIHHETEGTK
jgi:hypothetical protein